MSSKKHDILTNRKRVSRIQLSNAHTACLPSALQHSIVIKASACNHNNMGNHQNCPILAPSRSTSDKTVNDRQYPFWAQSSESNNTLSASWSGQQPPGVLGCSNGFGSLTKGKAVCEYLNTLYYRNACWWEGDREASIQMKVKPRWWIYVKRVFCSFGSEVCRLSSAFIRGKKTPGD